MAKMAFPTVECELFYGAPTIGTMSTTTSSDIITGERFEGLADLLVMDSGHLNVHPILHTSPLNVLPRIFLNNADSIRDGLQIINREWSKPPNIFIYSIYLNRFFQGVFPHINKPIILMTHNSDHEISEVYLPYLNSPKIHAWYAQNTRIHHPKLSTVPIGIANSQWPHGDIEVLVRVMRDVSNGTLCKRETNEPFVCFAVETNPSKRRPIAAMLARRSMPNRPCNMPYETYLRNLATYRYAISPPGNGIDCHRLWECIYLDVIPVVEDNSFYDNWQGIPIVRVSDWSTFELPSQMAPLASRRHCLTYYADSLL
jgi:hypothetical protein